MSLFAEQNTLAEKNTDTHLENTEYSSSEQSDNETKLIGKWIPDQKILQGAPPTYINLLPILNILQKENIFEIEGEFDPARIEISVMPGTKKGVVTPSINGKELQLLWNNADADSASIMLEFKYGDQSVYDSFNVEIWKPQLWMMTLIVLGGLGTFMFGMKYLSDGIQQIAGPSLRRMIALFTEHRVFAFVVGILVTILLQSSSVSTVMTIGFVNSQVITLAQAIGVILGANIGTTITSWILTLKISVFALPLVGGSALVYIFSKSERVKSFAAVLIGLGFLFFGMHMMGEGFSSLKELPKFSSVLQMFSALTVWGTIKCVLVGCALTILIQSSAAAIGVVMSLAMIGAIEDFPTAVAFILGENIGTTFTAVIASIGTSTNAKRAAIFHAVFNTLGVCWVLIIFRPVFIPTVEYTASLLNLKLVPFGIPLAHSIFNIANALLFLPFTKCFAALLTRYIPDRGKIISASETGLDVRHLESPQIAIMQSRLVVERIGDRCRKLMESVQKQVDAGLENEKDIQQLFREEEAFDRIQDEIINFTSKLLAKNVTSDIAESAREQLRIADEIESVSDYLISILKSNLKLKQDGLEVPADVSAGIRRIHETVFDMFQDINHAYVNRVKTRYFLDDIYTSCRKLTAELKNLRSRFMASISEEKIDPIIIVAVNSQLTFYRRIWEHLQNVVEAFCFSRN